MNLNNFNSWKKFVPLFWFCVSEFGKFFQKRLFLKYLIFRLTAGCLHITDAATRLKINQIPILECIFKHFGSLKLFGKHLCPYFHQHLPTFNCTIQNPHAVEGKKKSEKMKNEVIDISWNRTPMIKVIPKSPIFCD